jgi:hypothetical protein
MELAVEDCLLSNGVKFVDSVIEGLLGNLEKSVGRIQKEESFESIDQICDIHNIKWLLVMTDFDGRRFENENY